MRVWICYINRAICASMDGVRASAQTQQQKQWVDVTVQEPSPYFVEHSTTLLCVLSACSSDNELW